MTLHLLTLTVVNRSRVLLAIFMQNSSNCSLSKPLPSRPVPDVREWQTSKRG